MDSAGEAGKFAEVRMPMKSYRFGPKVSEDPRLSSAHTDAVLEAVGLADEKNEKY